METQDTALAPAAPEAPAPSMDDTIASTWKDISTREGLTDEKDAQAAEARARDEQGRFASKAPVIGENAIQPPADAPPVDPAAPEAAPAAEQSKVSKAPSSWRKEAAAMWDAMDPLIRGEVERREADFHKGIESFKARAQFADEIGAVIGPHMQTLQAQGYTPAYAIKTLLEAEATLRQGTPEQKAAMFNKWMRDYGVDPGVVQASNDPYVTQLQQRYEALVQQQQQHELQNSFESARRLNSQIQDFAANPEHEHFEAVRPRMAALLQAGTATDLTDAYQQAIWADPNIRALLLAKQQEAAKAEAQRKATAAKEAARVNVPQKGQLPSARPVGTIDDTLKENYARLFGA